MNCKCDTMYTFCFTFKTVVVDAEAATVQLVRGDRAWSASPVPRIQMPKLLGKPKLD
jgi:hypothetical protein